MNCDHELCLCFATQSLEMLSKLSEKDWYCIVFTQCDKNDTKIPQINKVVLKTSHAGP